MTTTQSSLEPNDAIDRIVAAASARGIEVQRTAPNQADFRRGSQAALRIKGAMFTQIEQFPVVAVIRADSSASGTQLVINSLDELIIGAKLGMNKKYTKAVEDFGVLLFNLAREVAP